MRVGRGAGATRRVESAEREFAVGAAHCVAQLRGVELRAAQCRFILCTLHWHNGLAPRRRAAHANGSLASSSGAPTVPTAGPDNCDRDDPPLPPPWQHSGTTAPREQATRGRDGPVSY